MPVWIAGGIALSSLIGAGVTAWMSTGASRDAKRSALRAEKLRIHFAEEETKREERKFRIQTALEKEKLSEEKKQNKYTRIQKFLDSLNNMQTSNINNSLSIADSLRRRRHA